MKIPVNEPVLNGNELKYISDCVTSGWISSAGKYIEYFEESMKILTNRKYAFAVSNGTIALDIAFHAIGLKKGDEVIVPSFTIISCINHILRIGAKPIFIDCEIDSWNIDVNQIEERITSKTKAILAVHIYGLTNDMNRLKEITKRHNLFLIEDAAEAMGQKYKEENCGSFGDISTTSFFANKHITTGEGGMVFTNCEKLAKKIKSARNLGFDEDPEKRFIHQEIGWNGRMTNLQAALGLAQYEQLDSFITKKIKLGNLYTKYLENQKNLILPLNKTEFSINHYWVYGILIKDGSIKSNELRRKLKLRGIDSRPFFYPLNKQPVIQKLVPEQHAPNSEFLYDYGLYIPSGIGTTEEQIKYVSDNLIDLLNEPGEFEIRGNS